MARYVAFLRAINVGGRIVKMDELRTIFEALKFKEVETLIASGNVMFSVPEPKSPQTRRDEELATTISTRLKKLLGYEVATFVRTTAEMQALTEYKAFSAAKVKDSIARNVAFLTTPLDTDAKKRLAAIQTDFEEFHAHGREVHCLSRRGLSQTTITTKMFERAVGQPASWRNVNTVAKIAAKLASHPS